jgi:hypothetical protein
MSPQNTQAKNGGYMNLGKFQGIAAFLTVDILPPGVQVGNHKKTF